MMKIPVKKIIKWAGLIGASGLLMIGLILAIAYWNRDFIIEKTKAALNKGIKGELTIGKINFTVFHQFPSFSVTLHQVTFKDSLAHYNTFAAGKIFLRIDFYQLLKKEINIKSFSVDDAEVNLFRAPNGDTNTDIFKSSAATDQADEESSIALTLPAFDLHDVKFAYVDSVRSKSYRFKFINTKNTLKQDSIGYDMQIAGDMYFDELIFNQEAGGFVVDKEAEVDLHLQLNQQDTTLILLPSMLQFDSQQLEVSGNFELVRQGNYSLLFLADDILLADGKALLNDTLNTILDKYALDQPIDVTVSLAGKFTPDYKPAVEVRFQSAHATFHYGKMEVNDLTLAGTFIQKADTTKFKGHRDARIEISSFTGEIEAVPFKGKVTFTQLYDPVMDLSMESKLNYTDLFSMVDTSRFVPRSGNFSTAFHYQGKLDEYLDPNRTHYEGKLEGKIRVSDGALHFKPKDFFFDKVNAVFNFNEKQFSINNLDFRINESPVQIQGEVKNFIPFFITPEDKGFVNVEVTSPTLDLTSLFAKRNKRPLTDQQAAQQRKKMTDLMDMAYKKLEFEIAVKADEVTFRKFKSENITGKVKLTENTIASDGINMEVAEGTTYLSFSLSDLEKNQSLLAVEANVKNANIREFFLYFDNFNQDAVVADNLTGFISTEVSFNALVDDNYSVIPPTMRGSINSSILNGGLLNFEPLENVGNFLFRKRDFSDVQFAQLNSNFTIDGTALDISRMEIQSTVLTLFLQGRYSFSDSTNLSVQLPLSNLKKRHKDYKPKNIGVDADAGASVYLHVYRYDDPKGKINIAYDPFKKWAKRIGER